MNITIRAGKNQKEELLKKGFSKDVNIHWLKEKKILAGSNTDVVFDLLFDDVNIQNNILIDEKIVFVHGVNCTCKEIDQPNYIRLNAWNSFINRNVIELAYSNAETKNKAANILSAMGWQFAFVRDDYGLISARIIAMIINEAYFALEEKVSSKEQIDIAMKLGTNYPYGPFEWGDKIGLKNIYHLLQKLSGQNKRYSISELLIHESQKI